MAEIVHMAKIVQNFDQYPFKVRVKTYQGTGKSPRLTWCSEYIGAEEVDWDAHSMYDLHDKSSTFTEFMFKNEHDRTLFMLRWAE